MSANLLDTPIENSPGISRKIIPALKHLGIRAPRDLLFYFPSRYEDFSRKKPIGEIEVGEVVTVEGKIQKISNLRTARKKMFLTEAIIKDEGGSIKAIWFNQPFIARNLKTDSWVALSGKVALGKKGPYLQNPAYEKIQNSKFKIQNSPAIHTGGLVAIYPETRGITSRWLRFLISKFLELRREIAEPVPAEILKKYNLPKTSEAILAIHFPKSRSEAIQAERRFIFEKMFLIQLRALRERLLLKKQRAPEIKLDIPLLKKFVYALPFELTDAQRRSIWEIARDLSKNRPMNRLLEGDVGSGKTVVAAAAALLAVKSGRRVVFMAPTEILARQHFATLTQVLKPFGIKIGLLTGAEKMVQKNTPLVVGTHALIQKGARFENLGLVIVDEQHRFGVQQRARLAKQQETVPHFLSMSATPIPRTLALTIYGDLDLSVLDEIPKSRKETITKIVEPSQRERAYQFIRQEVKKGRQAFVICPRIEKPSANNELAANLRINESQNQNWEVKAVKEEYKKLSEEIFPDLKVGMLHGKMKSKEKDAVMQNFKNRKTDILVSTSVIEVGIDVPNAAIMMIEGADRFGLAQLHQFRGRVGRGREQSYCFLFPSEDGLISRRLRAMLKAKNGFELAEIDLQIRGPGDLFGLRQWGEADGLFLKGITDPELVRQVRSEAVELIKKSPDLKFYPELKFALEKMEKSLHLE